MKGVLHMSKKEPSWRVLANDLIDGMIEWFGFRETLEWLKASGYTKEEIEFLGFDDDLITKIFETEGDGSDGVV
jgi:hypothetical protein